MIHLDTNHVSVLLDERHAQHAQMFDRLHQTLDGLAVPIVVLEEQMRGWLALIRRESNALSQIRPYQALTKMVRFFGTWHIAAWTAEAAEQFEQLRRAKIRIGTQDLEIASVALSNDALLLSANLRDFERVPGLHVEDWLYG